MSRFHLPVMTLHYANQGHICQTGSFCTKYSDYMNSEMNISTIKHTGYYTRIEHMIVGRDSSGGTATRYGLVGPRI